MHEATKTIQERNQRSSNIELFRILTMLLIIAHHYVVNSGLMLPTGPIYSNAWSFRSVVLLLFGAWGKIGINCFVIITGYFMCKSRITVAKFLKLYLEVVFYRLALLLVFSLTGRQAFSFQGLVKALVPMTTIDKGFPSSYLCFFLCIPFLNVLVNNLTEKQHLKLLLLCGFIYVFLETMKVLKIFSVNMNYVTWFVVVYFIGSYIRIYPKKLWNNRKIWCWMAVLSAGLSAASVVACTWLGYRMSGKQLAYVFVVDANTFPAVVTAVSAFLCFKNLEIKNSPIINKIAGSAFGVLLIHAGGDAMRQWLWRDLLSNVEMYHSAFWFVHAVLSVVGIYAVCTVIDWMRIDLLEKPFFRLWSKHEGNFLCWYRRNENAVCKKLGIETDTDMQ